MTNKKGATFFFYNRIDEINGYKQKKKRIERIHETTFFSVLSNVASDSITIKTEDKGLYPYSIINKQCVSLLTTYKGIACVVGYSSKYSNYTNRQTHKRIS